MLCIQKYVRLLFSNIVKFPSLECVDVSEDIAALAVSQIQIPVSMSSFPIFPIPFKVIYTWLVNQRSLLYHYANFNFVQNRD